MSGVPLISNQRSAWPRSSQTYLDLFTDDASSNSLLWYDEICMFRAQITNHCVSTMHYSGWTISLLLALEQRSGVPRGPPAEWLKSSHHRSIFDLRFKGSIKNPVGHSFSLQTFVCLYYPPDLKNPVLVWCLPKCFLNDFGFLVMMCNAVGQNEIESIGVVVITSRQLGVML